MSVEQGYPITMVHPNHQAAKLGEGNVIGIPEKFPNLVVEGSDSEARYRAQGYLRFGEARPVMVDRHEFPKMMRHPNYVPAVEAKIEAKIENNRIIGTFTIPGKPAEYPDLIVANADQEEKARENGYKPAGEYDRGALEAVLNGTVDEETYDPDEYPKWVDGVLIEKDPNANEEYRPRPEYPRYENGVLIQDPRAPKEPDPNLYPMWVHRNGKPSDESVLVKTPAEEFSVRAKWKKEEDEAKLAAEAATEEAEVEVKAVIIPKHKSKSDSAAASL